MAAKSASPAALQILQEVGLDSLPGDWRIVRIEDLLSEDRGISVGVMYPGIHDPEGVPLIKAGDLTDDRINPRPEFRITTEKHREYRRTELAGGELLISLVGEVGRCAVVPPRMAGWNAARAIAVLRFANPADAEFVRMCLMSAPLQHLMRAWSTTTVQATLNLKEIRQIPLPWPPKEERETIDKIINTLDDKIELNRRMNETLEAMARALFKSWFVDFDPVRAEAKGRDPGLPKQTTDLFPDAFEDSELGEIPRGWRVSSLGDEFDATKGVSYKGSGLSDAGMPLHNLNSVYEGGGYKYEGIKYYTGAYAERHLIKPGDIIVANTEQGHDRLLIGYAAIVPRLFGDVGIASHHIYRLIPKDGSELTAAYLCHLLNSPEMHDLVSGYANGTTVNMLPLAGVQQPKIVVPPGVLVKKFDDLASQIEARREETVVESRILAALRDTLLPKLMSGELKVLEAA